MTRAEGFGEQLEQIFAPFQRLDTTLTRPVPGLGLGLTLVHSVWSTCIVGRIGRECRWRGQCLPRLAASDARVGSEPAVWKGGCLMGAKKTTILAVDDATPAEIGRLNLEAEGFAALTTTDGQHALELVRSASPTWCSSISRCQRWMASPSASPSANARRCRSSL